jgi:pre-mRNA-splicing helicase BRR2
MEPHLRERQYDYSETTGRVIQMESENRKKGEPTGEADTLRGKISSKMGDKAYFSKPTDTLKKAFVKPDKRAPVDIPQGILYYPKTNETRSIYELFLSSVQTYIGDCPQEILRDAVDQILATLKMEGIQNSDKKIEIQAITGEIQDEVFNKFLSMSKQLIDYNLAKKENNEIEDMAVILDEKSEKEASEDENQQDQGFISFNANDIDSEWLEKILSPLFPDKTQEKEAQVLEILSIDDLRRCENRLVMALGFQNFDLVTLLISHKYAIYNTLRYYKSKTSEEKQALIKELSQTSEGHKLLETLVPDSGLLPSVPKRTLDLSTLEFEQGSFVMTNSKLVLPPGYQKITKPGYEEIVIPAPEPRQPKGIITHSKIPAFCQPAFNIKALNEIQSAVLPAALDSDINLLICAPTGAGKTNIGLMGILRLLQKHIKPNGEIDINHLKVVYIAPMKALVSEICGNLSHRLSTYNISVRELTGDSTISKHQIHTTQVIVTTPEKWDIITRKSGDRTFTENLKLMIIDEVHLLHDLRGPVLEAIVARTTKISNTRSQKIRIIGLSATLPNYIDVANFLQVPSEGVFFFDKSYRPVPLQQKYIGITENKAIKRFLLMNEICYEKLLEQAGKNQVLIFVHSRKETFKTAKALRDMSIQKQDHQKFMKDESKSKELLLQISESIENKEVKELITSGFCVHHAGLSKDDRKLIEDLFVDKHIQVLVSTATLAWGVNMPAHTVIIKGTQVYSPEKGTWIEISPQDLLQMIGRAGRIDYDSEGEGVIITSHSKLQYYLSLLNQQLPIESQFISQLPDHLNAEVVLGNIGTMADALQWIKTTYYPIRVEKSPLSYGYTGYSTLDSFLIDIIHSAAVLLDKHGLVIYDKKLGILQQTSLGQVASTYYIKPQSISIYNDQIKPYMGPIDLLKIFGLSYEFKYIPIREEEKLEVAKLMEKVPYPIKGSMDEPSSKMNILLQCYISKLKLEGYTLMADMVYISQSAGRILRALFEICIRRGWAQLTLITLNIYKMIIHKMWSVMSPLRQFNRLPEDLILKLEKKEGLSWDLYYDLSLEQLTELLKAPSKASLVHTTIRNFPKLLLNAYVQPITRTCLRVELAINKDFEWDMDMHNNSQIFWVIVEDVDSEVILHYEQFVMKMKHSDKEHLVIFTVPLFEPLPPQYFIRVVSDKWLGCETLLPVSFKHLILPEKLLEPSPILDIAVKTAALKWPAAEEILNTEWLTPLQSQVFDKLYNANDSLLFSAPDGTTEIGLIGLFRSLIEGSDKIIYLTHFQDSAAIIYERLHKLKEIGETIGILSGNLSSDLKILAENRVTISCAEFFETITRRWRQRKALHSVSLLIADQLHLIGEPGSNLEVCVSRMRYAFTQLEQPLRIIGLCCSVTNANDIGEWIGAKLVWNFLPTSRSVPLNLIIESFEHNYRPSRILAMTKPVYTAIKSHSYNSSAVVVVPDRKVAKTLALDLILFSASENVKFNAPDSLPHIEEKIVRHSLDHGIGILSEKPEPEILNLFKTGALQILIITGSSCWSLEVACKLLVIMDTCHYSGKEHRYQDYSIPEMLQMLSFAKKSSPTAVILAHSARKEFLKKFLYEAYPVESHLDHYLEDHYNAEIVSKTINSKQDAVDWITWTFMYRRLTQNPNYYNLEGVSGAHINDHLSELVENTLDALHKSKCAEVFDFEVKSTNLGLIASHYSIKCGTADIFSSSLTPNSKIRSILEILVCSVELESFPVRPGEEKILKEINSCLPEPLEKAYLNIPTTKALLLLLSHFSRLPLTSELAHDTYGLLIKAPVLINSLLDISTNHGWLFPAIHCMTLCQMLTQAIWDKDSPLLQLPYFNPDLVDSCKDNGVEDIVDLMNLEDDDRNKILNMDIEKIQKIASFCNAYPSVSLNFEKDHEGTTGEIVTIDIELERDGEYCGVLSPYYPIAKDEYWWVVVGQPKTNRLFGIKKTKITDKVTVRISFIAPEIGSHECLVYLLCDSYFGADQGEKINLTIYA